MTAVEGANVEYLLLEGHSGFGMQRSSHLIRTVAKQHHSIVGLIQFMEHPLQIEADSKDGWQNYSTMSVVIDPTYLIPFN